MCAYVYTKAIKVLILMDYLFLAHTSVLFFYIAHFLYFCILPPFFSLYISVIKEATKIYKTATNSSTSLPCT